MIKKTLPYYAYQIDAIESWLDEQARSGLFLQERRLGRMCFQQDTPRPMRYRASPPTPRWAGTTSVT